jgi:phospholipid/cholesterol/gamma-HCH transport system substrate-binding protein
MRFKIRYADQIVGFFSIGALIGLVSLVVALGAKQNWFVKKHMYQTEFESGSNISVGMDVAYKGFSIGKIKSIGLIDDKVKVQFYVLEDYLAYVKTGSLVEVIVSPIGLGSQFVFHPGSGSGVIPPGSEIYRLDSENGKRIIEAGLNTVVTQTDSIGALLAKVSVLIDNLGKVSGEVNNALVGKGNAPLTLTLANVRAISANIALLSARLSDPTGIVPKVLGPDMTQQLTDILAETKSITGQLSAVSGNANTLVLQSMPQVDSALSQLNTLLLQIQDVLTGIRNNPLIRNGIPDRTQSTAATPQTRNADF